MNSSFARLRSVDGATLAAQYTLVVDWECLGNPTDRRFLTESKPSGNVSGQKIDLTGLIARRKSFQPISDPNLFAKAALKDNGRAVWWPADNRWGELDVSADTLEWIGQQQMEINTNRLRAWQDDCALSNQEAADAIGVSLRTWKNYREGKSIPKPVQVALLAMLREHTLEAHYRPRKAGRPGNPAKDAA